MLIGAPFFERGPPLSEIQNSSIFSLDDMSDEEMNSLIDGTITDFDEGDLVTGTVVKIEHDEVLLSINADKLKVLDRNALCAHVTIHVKDQQPNAPTAERANSRTPTWRMVSPPRLQ